MPAESELTNPQAEEDMMVAAVQLDAGPSMPAQEEAPKVQNLAVSAAPVPDLHEKVQIIKEALAAGVQFRFDTVYNGHKVGRWYSVVSASMSVLSPEEMAVVDIAGIRFEGKGLYERFNAQIAAYKRAVAAGKMTNGSDEWLFRVRVRRALAGIARTMKVNRRRYDLALEAGIIEPFEFPRPRV
jgi:hypothetical protein